MKIYPGKVVKIHYTLSLADGEVIDSTKEEHAFPYLHGADNIVPGLETKLEGCQVKDRIRVRLQPAEGFGEYDEELIHEIGLDALPEAMDLAEGDELFLLNDDDEEVPGIIEEIKSESIIVNYNHPLAGETLIFDVEVVEIREATSEELEHGHAHDEHYDYHGEEDDDDWDQLWEAQ